MEFKITKFTPPEAVQFNYDELKSAITEKAARYETLVYTEDDIKDAKKDRADLNKLSKALNDERIRLEREYMAPFNDFKAQIKEICGIIDKPVCLIDSQIKDFESRKKEEKKEAIKEIYNSLDHPEWLSFEGAFSDSWLKSTYSLNHLQKQVIPDFITAIEREAKTLEELPQFGFEALEIYKKTLDMAAALKTAKEMSEIAAAKEKARQEAEIKAKQAAETKQETLLDEPKDEPKAEKKTWLNFSAELTARQAVMLRDFFVANGINFKKI